MVDLADPAKEQNAMPATSKKQHVIDDLRDQIARGVYQPGDKLPSGKQLCETYGVSMIVIREAIGWLKARGEVDSVPGVGYFVTTERENVDHKR
jgi:DNA-binding GntR family transcriptional regulator